MITLEEQAILQAIEETSVQEAAEAHIAYISLIMIRYESIRNQLYFDKAEWRLNENEHN